MEEQPKPFHDMDETESVSGNQPPRPVPTQLGPFIIESLIGSGGMGSVYRAFDESMKRPVALKVLHPSIGQSVAYQRFDREAWIVGQLDHPNIIRVYSRGEEAEIHFLAMELADGGSLADRLLQIRKEASKSGDVTATITTEYIHNVLAKFIDLCEAVEYVHNKGFFHRDIKPNNILLTESGSRLKLTDFGIAHADDMTSMTRAGDFMGTLKYMSPEQLAAHRADIDKRTDIYSLGVTLYELLTLQLPYDGDTDEKYVSAILAGRSVPARRRHARIPMDVETVLMKATEHDPQGRYQSAHEFALDLKAILENRPITARRTGLLGRAHKFVKRHRPTITIGVSVAIILVATIAYFESWRNRSLDRIRIVQVLQTVVASGKAPVELEHDWSRLWPLLVKEVNGGNDDSLEFWFHRAIQPRLPLQDELRDKPIVMSRSVSLFPIGATDSGQTFALVTRISELGVSDVFEPTATAWSYYSLAQPAGGFGYEMNTARPAAGVSGLLRIKLRIISEHYRHGVIYTDETTEAEPTAYNNSGISLSDIPIVIKDPSKGDRLEPFLTDTTFAEYSIVRIVPTDRTR
ncbi:MAG: serine/threonine protein kinase [bacterium]|nr:serine/threonine protein kinase [bacterium]